MEIEPKDDSERDSARHQVAVDASQAPNDFASKTVRGLSPRTVSLINRFELPAAVLVIAVVMSCIQFGGPAILDNDGYYHIRWALMLRQSFPHLPAFKALPLTTLDESHYVDHHYLFHVLLFPFTFGDLRLGAKLAAIFFSTLGIASIYALLVSYRVRWRFLWLAPIIASSEPFLYRMST